MNNITVIEPIVIDTEAKFNLVRFNALSSTDKRGNTTDLSIATRHESIILGRVKPVPFYV